MHISKITDYAKLQLKVQNPVDRVENIIIIKGSFTLVICRAM